MRSARLILLLALVLLATSRPAGAAAPSDPAPHPALPDPDRHWPGVMLLVVAGLFVAAALIGPAVLAADPDDETPSHAHDEPPGSSHHHGAEGTLNPPPYR